MRIVHALGWYFPESLGGTEVYVDALARQLKDEGHEVLVTAPDPQRDAEESYQYNGIDVFRYPVPPCPSRDEVQTRTRTRGTEGLHRWLERNRADVFHCHSLVTGLGLEELKVARSLGARVIVTCHTPSLGFICQRGTMMRWGRALCDGVAEPAKCAACALQARGVPERLASVLGELPAGLSARGSRIPGRVGTLIGMPDLIRHNASLQRQLVDTVDAVVVLTEWARKTLAVNHRSEQKLVLNRLGIAAMKGVARHPRNRPLREPLRLGYMGRFHVTKGLFVLANAVARLPKELPFSLELRGPTTNESDLVVQRELRDLFGHDPRITFAPAVPHVAVGDILETYDLFVCPSIWLEGGPTVAIEAQAVGTPVMGSRIGGLAEIVEDGKNGRLVPPGDASALASAIAEVVANPNIILSWRRNLRKPRTMVEIARDYLGLYA
jgi:glycosyltransferase involved in cell wall biosynthesis